MFHVSPKPCDGRVGSRRVGRAIVLAAVLVMGALTLAAPADAFVYWASNTTSSIGRANLDGTGVNETFITVGGHPQAVAVDGQYVYWSTIEPGTIGRAKLDGTDVDPNFISGLPDAEGIAVTNQ